MIDQDMCDYCFVNQFLSDEEAEDFRNGKLLLRCDGEGECSCCGEWGVLITGYCYADDVEDSEDCYDEDYDNGDEDEDNDGYRGYYSFECDDERLNFNEDS